MNLSRYQEHYSLSHRLKRYGWYVINRTLFRMMATNAMKVPRNLLLRLFGAPSWRWWPSSGRGSG